MIITSNETVYIIKFIINYYAYTNILFKFTLHTYYNCSYVHTNKMLCYLIIMSFKIL